MMKVFHARITGPSCEYKLHACHDMRTMQTINDIYAAGRAAGNAIISDGSLQNLSGACSIPDLTYHWPPVDKISACTIEKQLRDSVSIYNNGGIFGKFEKAWKNYHSFPQSHTLLHNSRTNALQALYFAIQVQPGDEVCCETHSIQVSFSLRLLPGHISRLQLPRNQLSSDAIWYCPNLLRHFR